MLPNRAFNLTFLILAINFFVLGLLSTIIGVSIPEIKADFQINNEQAGALFVYWSAGFFIGAFFGGKAFYVLNIKALFIVVSLASITCLSVLYATDNIIVFGIVSFLLSSFLSTLLTAGHAVAARINSRNKAATISILDFTVSMGNLATPLLINFVYRSNVELFDWRSIFALSGILLLISVILVLANRFDSFKLDKEDTFTRGAGYLRVIFTPVFFSFMVACFFMQAVEWGHIVWFVTYASEGLQLTANEAREVFTYFLGGMVIARFLNGVYLARRFKPSLLLITMLVSATVASFIILTVADVMLLSIFNFAFGFGYGAVFPLLLGLSMDVEPRYSALLSGIGLMAGTIGAQIASYLIGFLSENVSINYAYGYVFFSMAALLMSSLLFIGLQIRASRLSADPETRIAKPEAAEG
ncbi:MAG: MFS transporter [Aquisalimonadaceae bacterium]